jgi:hypothetical protein
VVERQSGGALEDLVPDLDDELTGDISAGVRINDFGLRTRTDTRSNVADNNVVDRQSGGVPDEVDIIVGVGPLGVNARIDARSDKVDNNDVVKRQLPPLSLPELTNTGILTLTDTTPSRKYCSFDLREAFRRHHLPRRLSPKRHLHGRRRRFRR